MIFTMRLNNIKTQNFWTILDLYTMYCMYCISYMVKGIFVPSPCIASDELVVGRMTTLRSMLSCALLYPSLPHKYT